MRFELRAFRSERANGVLELMLFTPVLLFFVLVVIDAGVMELDHAGLTDTLRRGMNSEGLVAKQFPPLTLDPIGSRPVVIDGNVGPFLNGVAEHTARSLATLQGVAVDSSTASYRIAASLYLLSIDPQTGRIIGPPSQIGRVDWGTLRDSEIDPLFPIKGEAEFIEERLSSTAESAPSPFASAAPFLGDGGSEPRYLSSSVVLVGEIVSRTRGLNSWATRELLGRHYMFQGQELRLLRTQVM